MTVADDLKIRPHHRLERFSRVQNKAAYDERFDAIFRRPRVHKQPKESSHDRTSNYTKQLA